MSSHTAAEYRAFGRQQAKGRSRDYEALAYAVAADERVLSFLGQLPEPKRQPNLLFASARFLLGAPPEPTSLRELVTSRAEDLKARDPLAEDADQRAGALRCPDARPRRPPRAPRPPRSRSVRRLDAPPGRLFLRLRRPPSERPGP